MFLFFYYFEVIFLFLASVEIILLVTIAGGLALAINCDGKNLINCDLIAKNTFRRVSSLEDRRCNLGCIGLTLSQRRLLLLHLGILRLGFNGDMA